MHACILAFFPNFTEVKKEQSRVFLIHTLVKNTGNGREIPSKKRLSRHTSTNYRNNSNSKKINASHCEERVQEPGRILGN